MGDHPKQPDYGLLAIAIARSMAPYMKEDDRRRLRDLMRKSEEKQKAAYRDRPAALPEEPADGITFLPKKG